MCALTRRRQQHTISAKPTVSEGMVLCTGKGKVMRDDKLIRRSTEPMAEEAQPDAELVPDGERPCPVCGEKMVVEKERGVRIDVCEAHGVWLDKGELRRIQQGVGRRSRNAARRRLKREKSQAKLKGILFGWFSLLMD